MPDSRSTTVVRGSTAQESQTPLSPQRSMRSQSPSTSWFASGPAAKNTDNLTSEAISIPAGAQRVKLSFWHKYNLNSGNDGGVLEFSLDNAATWFSVTNTGTAEAITTGGYNVTMSNPSNTVAVSITVNPVNDKPTADAQSVETLEDTARTRL